MPDARLLPPLNMTHMRSENPPWCCITIEQVLDLSNAGLLPPILAYCATFNAEYIEFRRPINSSSRSGSGSAESLYPVMWFRCVH